MEIKDFKKEGNERYISNEIFSFENNIAKFNYRISLIVHTYQDDNSYGNMTRYQVYMIVDDSSVHPNHKDYYFKEREHGFLLKKVEKKGDFNVDVFEKTLNAALKIKIENKIKVDAYQKIKGILSGGEYYL